MNNRRVAFLAALACAAASVQGLAGQGSAIPKALDASKAVGILASSCASCHDWAGAYDTIVDPAVVVPGDSGSSPAWLAIAEDRMPPQGTLGDADKALVLAWIDAGAPRPEPRAGAAGGAVAGGRDAASPSARFLGFANKEDFHRFSGWASGGVLLAAGIVGAVHAYDMMSRAHDYRDSLHIEEFDPTRCPPEIAYVYGDPTQVALHWTHVGLLAAGESFYIANALTGTSFMGKLGPGWSKAKIHRYAFFVHAGLMVSEAAMGYFSSEALSRGDHGTFHVLLAVHAGVGLAIPAVILGAGAIMDPKIKL